MENYIVNSDGTIISTKFGKKRELKPNVVNGYYYVSLSNNKKVRTILIHRLVALEYIPNPLNLSEVNHIDGNKSNNDASNLEWCTHSENQLHSYRTGLNSHIGSKNNLAKLTEEQVLKIRELYNTGVSQTLLSQTFNVTKCAISKIITRKHWSHI